MAPQGQPPRAQIYTQAFVISCGFLVDWRQPSDGGATAALGRLSGLERPHR